MPSSRNSRRFNFGEKLLSCGILLLECLPKVIFPSCVTLSVDGSHTFCFTSEQVYISCPVLRQHLRSLTGNPCVEL